MILNLLHLNQKDLDFEINQQRSNIEALRRDYVRVQTVLGHCAIQNAIDKEKQLLDRLLQEKKMREQLQQDNAFDFISFE
jgi:hypothetical protein